MVQHHCHSVVEQRLSKYYDVEDLVDVDLLEDGEHGHRVYGRDERREEEHVQEGRLAAEQVGLARRPQGEADGQRVEDGADHGEQQDRAQVVEEEPVGHEVAGVQDDGRQHVQEEDVGRQRADVHLARVEEDRSDQQPHHDQ